MESPFSISIHEHLLKTGLANVRVQFRLRGDGHEHTSLIHAVRITTKYTEVDSREQIPIPCTSAFYGPSLLRELQLGTPVVPVSPTLSPQAFVSFLGPPALVPLSTS